MAASKDLLAAAEAMVDWVNSNKICLVEPEECGLCGLREHLEQCPMPRLEAAIARAKGAT